MKQINPIYAGILQALGIVLYIFILVAVIFPISQNFGLSDSSEINLAPFFALLLFSVSALTCGIITFAYPFQLFVKKEAKGAIKVLITMLITLITILIITIISFVSFTTTYLKLCK